MNNESFQKGDFDTSFVDREFDIEHLRAREKAWQRIAALGAAWRRHNESAKGRHDAEAHTVMQECGSSGWKEAGRKEALR